ncbi:unnamed protein product, partial [Pylaiella littoralis]
CFSSGGSGGRSSSGSQGASSTNDVFMTAGHRWRKDRRRSSFGVTILRAEAAPAPAPAGGGGGGGGGGEEGLPDAERDGASGDSDQTSPEGSVSSAGRNDEPVGEESFTDDNGDDGDGDGGGDGDDDDDGGVLEERAKGDADNMELRDFRARLMSKGLDGWG